MGHLVALSKLRPKIPSCARSRPLAVGDSLCEWDVGDPDVRSRAIRGALALGPKRKRLMFDGSGCGVRHVVAGHTALNRQTVDVGLEFGCSCSVSPRAVVHSQAPWTPHVRDPASTRASDGPPVVGCQYPCPLLPLRRAPVRVPEVVGDARMYYAVLSSHALQRSVMLHSARSLELLIMVCARLLMATGRNTGQSVTQGCPPVFRSLHRPYSRTPVRGALYGAEFVVTEGYRMCDNRALQG